MAERCLASARRQNLRLMRDRIRSSCSVRGDRLTGVSNVNSSRFISALIAMGVSGAQKAQARIASEGLLSATGYYM